MYARFHALLAFLVQISPILMWEKQLPSSLYVPFGIDQTNIGYGVMYFYILGINVYATGLYVAFDMSLFGIFVCITFFLSLLSSRVSRMGYSNGFGEHCCESPSSSKKSFYREMCKFIEQHLKIDR